MKITVFLVILVFLVNVHSISVSHCSFWFLRCVFVLFAICFKMFLCLCFFCLLSCFVLNHNIRFSFALHLLFLLLFFAFVFCCLLILGYLSKSISRNIGNSENPHMKNAEKKHGYFDNSS